MNELERAKHDYLRHAARQSPHNLARIIVKPEEAALKQFTPTAFSDYIFDRWVEGHNGLSQRDIFSAPPREGKSLGCSRVGPLWELMLNPKMQIGIVSFAASLSVGHSYWIREMIRSEMGQWLFPGLKVAPLRGRVGEWFTTAGGRVQAAGIPGGITGKGLDLLIVDDPYSGMKDAYSIARRETVWNWWLSEAQTRLSPDGRVIVIHTRWHPQDFIGQLTDPERKAEAMEMGLPWWRYVNIQAEAGPDDVLKRQTNVTYKFKKGDGTEGSITCGEFLNIPRRRLPWYLLNRANALIWSSMFQGLPRLAGGSIIDPKCITVVDAFPANLLWRWCYDPATSTKKHADFSVLGLVAMDKFGNFWIRELHRWKAEYPVAKAAIITNVKRLPFPFVGEGVAGFLAVMQDLRTALTGIAPSVYSVTPVGDKTSRAVPWMANATAGKMFILRGGWNNDYLAEIADFPLTDHDDQIDMTSIGWQACVSSGGSAKMVFA